MTPIWRNPTEKSETQFSLRNENVFSKITDGTYALVLSVSNPSLNEGYFGNKEQNKIDLDRLNLVDLLN